MIIRALQRILDVAVPVPVLVLQLELRGLVFQ